MSFYTDQKKALTALDKVLDSAYKDKSNVDIDALIYEILKNHAVSPSSIRKQIERYAKTRNVVIKDDIMEMNR